MSDTTANYMALDEVWAVASWMEIIESQTNEHNAVVVDVSLFDINGEKLGQIEVVDSKVRFVPATLED